MKKSNPKNNYKDFNVRIIPRSSRNEIAGREGDLYRIKVTSPPVDGKANKALIIFLSKMLKIPKSDIEIISGEKSRIKRIRVHDISSDEFSRIMD